MAGTKRAIPSGQSHLARSSSQSEHSIRFILLACGASHNIIKPFSNRFFAFVFSKNTVRFKDRNFAVLKALSDIMDAIHTEALESS